MRCDFCGFVFERDNCSSGCKGCPMNKNCGKVKCPNCNYELIADTEIKFISTLRNWGKKIWKK